MGRKCFDGDKPLRPASGSDLKHSYDITAQGGISALISGWLGASVDLSRARKVIVSAKDIQHEDLTSPYANKQQQGKCNGFQYQDADYVQSADKAKTVKYTLTDQWGAAVEAGACKQIGSVSKGAGGHLKAIYSNQIEFTANQPVYYQIALKHPLPTAVNFRVFLNGDFVTIPNTNSPTLYIKVTGPFLSNNNPSYTVEIGPDAASMKPEPVKMLRLPVPLQVGSVPYDVMLYRLNDPKEIGVQFVQTGAAATSPSSVAGNSTSPGSGDTTADHAGADNTPATSLPTASACSPSAPSTGPAAGSQQSKSAS